MELVAALLQVLTQLHEVINAAVEDEADLPVFGKHGLVAGGAKVEDG